MSKEQCPKNNKCEEGKKWEPDCAYWVKDGGFCSKIRKKEVFNGWTSQLYGTCQNFYMLLAESEHNLENLSEAMEELEELKAWLSEKIKTLRVTEDRNGKYTLKQLHQAWGAGRLSVEKR